MRGHGARPGGTARVGRLGLLGRGPAERLERETGEGAVAATVSIGEVLRWASGVADITYGRARILDRLVSGIFIVRALISLTTSAE